MGIHDPHGHDRRQEGAKRAPSCRLHDADARDLLSRFIRARTSRRSSSAINSWLKRSSACWSMARGACSRVPFASSPKPWGLSRGICGTGVAVDGNGHNPYDRMKELLEGLNDGVPRGERWTVKGERSILAMAGKNDPFYAGQPAQAEKARWFAELYYRLGFAERRTHLRYLHYTFAGEEPNPITGEKSQERLPDGTPYENTDENWTFLVEVSKHARNMGLIDPRRIIDRRTPRPYLYGPDAHPSPPVAHVFEPSLELPESSCLHWSRSGQTGRSTRPDTRTPTPTNPP